MSTLATNAITDASGGNTATINGYTPTMSNMAGRNRIINGDMRIDQRNAGASVTPAVSTLTYTLDRWLQYQTAASKFSVQRNAGLVTPPSGFTNYLGITSLSAYSAISSDVFLSSQYIEGFNVADFAWGTANATPVTLSFWVRSSLTGTFSFSLCNFISTRNYIATYTISSSNTWEYKTVTIPGDTSGAWVTDNRIGLQLRFDLGSGSNYNGTAGSWSTSNLLRTSGSQSVVGTSGATFYITGVQLEEGSVATPFEHRQYGQELALCQRYFYRMSGNDALQDSYQVTQGFTMGIYWFPVTMRATPTLTSTITSASNQYSGSPSVASSGNHSLYFVTRAASTGRNYAKLTDYDADAEL